MTVLVTGAAGFIGYHVCKALVERGDKVLGVDNINDYYDTELKKNRIKQLTGRNGFSFEQLDITSEANLATAASTYGPIKRVVHLAAQAGVRHSIDNPMSYIQANLVGHATIVELCRRSDQIDHLVYASSSSVYGGNTKLPFAIEDRVDRPLSLYAATKKADELMSHAYSHLYDLPQTGLRFFTVYGPWGRPDMAMWKFTKAILAGEPIRVFNHGDMKRDFTYIDDIVAGILASLDNPPVRTNGAAPYRLYNIGNHRSEPLLKLIEILEEAIGQKAERLLEPMQPGDVKESFADIDDIRRDVGYEPTTPIEVGVPKFVDWYRSYHSV